MTNENLYEAIGKINDHHILESKLQKEKNPFVWVRRTSGDLFLTYPTRPEFTGLESGGIYTLEELQTKLTEAYTQ